MVEQLQEKALAQMETQDYQQALNTIYIALQLAPQEVESHWIAADAHAYLGHVDTTFLHLNLAKQIDPKNSKTYHYLAYYYQETHQIVKALESYDKALVHAKTKEDKFHLFISRGVAKGIFRMHQESLNDLMLAYEVDSTYFPLVNDIAVIYMHMEEDLAAIKFLRKAFQLDSNQVAVAVNLGMTYSRVDSLQKSEYYFNKAIDLDASDALIYSNRGYLFYKQKKYKKALRDFKKSIKIYPTNSYVYKNRALVYLALEMKEEACQDLERAAKLGFADKYGNEVRNLYLEHCK